MTLACRELVYPQSYHHTHKTTHLSSYILPRVAHAGIKTMWASLTNDLKEFVSGVEDETVVVATKISHGVDALEQLGGGGGSGEDTVIGDDGFLLESGFEATGMVSSPADEAARRRTLEETYTLPLDESRPEVVAFLEAFDLESKTELIATLLGTSATMKERFEQVCPERVTYKDFWMRYFFRCNEKRIELEWQEEQEATKKSRDAVISSGIATVTSLFGGAVKAVSKAVERNDRAAQETIPASPFAFHSGATSLFGGRPPFVLNTAVDDDDDDEEEVLGWGDDDDSSDEEGNMEEPNESNFTEEEIEFTDGADDDKLNQALAERDSLQQTIKLQAKELAALKEGKESPAFLNQLEELKMKLFEKDAELAAFKASGEDNQLDNKQAKVDFDSIKSLEAMVDKLKEAMDQQALDTAKAKKEYEAELAAKANEFEVKIAALESDNAVLESQTLQEDNNGHLASALQATLAAKGECEVIKVHLVDTQSQLALSNKTCVDLESQLAHLKGLMESQQAAFEERLNEAMAQFEAAAEESATGCKSKIVSLSLQLEIVQRKVVASDLIVADLTKELATLKGTSKTQEGSLTDCSKSTEDESNDTISTGVQVNVQDDDVAVPTLVAAPVSTEESSEPTLVSPSVVESVAESNDNAEPEEDWGDDW